MSLEDLFAKLSLNNKNKNVGELDEIKVIAKLFRMSKSDKPKKKLKLIELFGQNARDGIIVLDPTTLKEIIDINSIKKSSRFYKCDCAIKFISTQEILKISIKSFNGKNPAIINHTPRSANVFQSGVLQQDIPYLDQFISIINNKRINKESKQDIFLRDITINDKIKESINNTLKYFIFKGSGSRISKLESNCILYVNTFRIRKWTFYNCIEEKDKDKYVSSIYDKCIVSMRSKGMPNNKDKLTLSKPWIYKDTQKGKILLKGSFHVRVNLNL